MVSAAFVFSYFIFFNLHSVLMLCFEPLHGCENFKIILSSLEGLIADEIGTGS